MITLKYTRGFTLVEMMIAMTISLILLLGVSQIFSSNKRSQKVTEGLARVQENARFAMKKLSIDMRRAGYIGCAGDHLSNHLDPTDPGYNESLFDFTKGTAGWEYTKGVSPSQTEPGRTYTLSTLDPTSAEAAVDKWTNDSGNDLPTSLEDQVVPGSDVLVMKWVDDDITGINLDGIVNPNSAQMKTLNAHGITKGTILVVSDCSGGDVFQTTSAPNSKSLQRSGAQDSPGNLNPGTKNWSHKYPAGATVSSFTSRAYYIGQGTSGEPSLYSITYNQGATAQVTEEIAEGIENMQVLYGLDINADKIAEKYVTAEEVTDHSDVVNLKVAIIARSPEDAKTLQAARNLQLLGTTISIPADRKIRFVFTSTVKLRNKGVK